MFKTYLWLTKPGIIGGNLITAAGGFFLASKGDIDVWLLLATIAGIACIIACACVFNNYIDRSIDQKMARTKRRALAKGTISTANAMIYGALLGIVGFLTLLVFVNLLTVAIGLLGLFFYLVMYGIWKRRSTLGTVVGSVSGATPIAAGYVAVTNRIDAAAVILFLMLIFWQMPHFYAIAMRRRADYAAAGIPVLPVKKGMRVTKIYILLYIGVFMITSYMLALSGYVGMVYVGIVTLLGGLWLQKGIQGFKALDDTQWARTMFLFSLKVIIAVSITIAVEAWIP